MGNGIQLPAFKGGNVPLVALPLPDDTKEVGSRIIKKCLKKLKKKSIWGHERKKKSEYVTFEKRQKDARKKYEEKRKMQKKCGSLGSLDDIQGHMEALENLNFFIHSSNHDQSMGHIVGGKPEYNPLWRMEVGYLLC